MADSDAKSGRGYSSIHTIRGVLRPAFQMADHDVLLKNPFEFQLATITLSMILFVGKRFRKNKKECF